MINKDKNILFISGIQYGYSSDYYYYTRYLSSFFNVYIISRNQGLPSIKPGSVHNIEFKLLKNKILRHFIFIRQILGHLKNNQYDLIFVNFFYFNWLLPLVFRNKKFVLDIRSGGVGNKQYKRFLKNIRIKYSLMAFNKAVVLSDSLARKLGIPENKYDVLPLGAEILSTKNKMFNTLHLLYIGTFQGRRIHETIEGFARFCRDIPGYHTYTLIGHGHHKDIEPFRKAIKKYKMQNQIFYVGRLHHDQAKKYFDGCNVGVSYVPITSYYNVQPPTKTFEYLCSGLPVIATKTTENRKVINEHTGTLIQDNSESFYKGLLEIWKNRKNYNSESIRQYASQFTWEKIVKNILVPFIKANTESY